MLQLQLLLVVAKRLQPLPAAAAVGLPACWLVAVGTAGPRKATCNLSTADASRRAVRLSQAKNPD